MKRFLRWLLCLFGGHEADPGLVFFTGIKQGGGATGTAKCRHCGRVYQW